MYSTVTDEPSPHILSTASDIPPNAVESNVEPTVVEQKYESEDAGHISEFENVDCGSWQDGPNWKCHASFGDQETTATVGAFGQLLQFSSFLGVGSSGMFSADHHFVEEPCLVTYRAQSLQELSEQSFHFGSKPMYDHYGLRFTNLIMKPDSRPNLKWTFWRWPRHIYPSGSFRDFPNLKLTIQWMVHENTILQQCLLENDHDDDISIDMMFHKAMIIRDLDHLDWDHKFNIQGHKNHDIRPGPTGYSWICAHKLNAEPPEGIPADSRLPRSNTTGSDSSQVREDLLSSHELPSPQAAQKDASSCDSVQIPGQQDGAGPCGPLHNPPLSHKSNPSTRSRTDEIRARAPRPKSQDHEAQSKNAQDISVISSVTINGEPQLFEDKGDPQTWSFVIKGRHTPGHGRPRTHEVITAYEMKTLDNPELDSLARTIPLHKMNVRQFLRSQQPDHPLKLPLCVSTPENASSSKQKEDDKATFAQRQYFPLDPVVGILGKLPPGENSNPPQSHLWFAVRRNLEHILSVCTIQATPKPSGTTVASPLPEKLRKVRAVALTCGDMSGHRICWSASFFAFQFLIAFHKLLRSLPDEERNEKHVSVLEERIERTCLGHLKWLHLSQQQSSGQRFGANYWVSGDLVVKSKSSHSWTPGDNLLDTGFQILKASACTNLCAGTDDTAKLMSEWAPSWLDSMERSDRRQKYAWPHAENEGVSTFRLDEHVWIWRALKSLEKNDRQAWNLMSEKVCAAEKQNHQAQRQSQLAVLRLEVPSFNSSFAQLSNVDIGRLRKTFASDIVQREVTKRFTTENDMFQKRMLAVTRSARETRFLLHSRDTALFYNEMSDFFGRDTSIQGWDLWKNTIDCQKCHDGYQESNWENPLRYALCIMMGTQGLKINSKPPEEMVRTAIEVIFCSSSLNGFFPGRLDLMTKKPVELSSIAQEDRDFYYHASFEIPYILLTHFSQVSDVYKRLATPTDVTRSKSDIKDPSILPDEADDRQTLLVLSRISRILSGQPTVPYLDNHDIIGNFRQASTHQRVAMKKFMPFNNLINSSSIVKVEDEWLFKYPDFFMRETPLENGAGENVPGAVEDDQVDPERSREIEFLVIDIPSKKLIEGKQANREPHQNLGYSNYQLSRILGQNRTARDSKKRLIHIRKATESMISICCNATEASERDNMQEFFSRHKLYEKHVIDQCNMVSNTWETELHLSYYEILQGLKDPLPGIPSYDHKQFPGGKGKQIVRASVSFRFQGDFFDRFWTCYMLEHSQNGFISTYFLLDEKENRQRKVLEQQFFFDILVKLVESTTEILQEVKTFLGFKSGLFPTSIHSTNEYSTWSQLWQKFEPLLQELDDDLRSTQATVDQWEAREEERGEEKPRWTGNDEKKYRAPITKIRRKIKYERRKLRDLHANIKTFREACSDRLVRAREELSFRSDQNIAMFTYVTVVFLPLGFTDSIFSMNGSPERSLAVNMVVASVIALAVTILALMNAKGLAGVADSISTSFKGLTDDAKKSSVLIRDRRYVEDKGTTFKGGDPKPPHLGVSSTDVISWDLLFWIGYIFIELPSRSITAACRALRWPRDNRQGMKGLAEAVAHEIAHSVRMCLGSGEDDSGDPEMHQSSFEEPIAGPTAQTKMDAVDQQHRGKQEYFNTIAHVLLGFFTILMFLPLWILQILCFYAWDTLALFGEFLHQGISRISLPESDGFESRLMGKLTKLPEKLRPMKRLKNQLKSKREHLQRQVSTTAGGGEEIVSCPDDISGT